MMKYLASKIAETKSKKNDHRKLSLSSFSQASYMHPIMINNDFNAPILLSRNDLKQGVYLDGADGVGVKTVGDILLTQLISQGGGLISLLDISKDTIAVRALYASAAFYGRENDIVVITEENINNITTEYLKSQINENKIIVVSTNGGEHKGIGIYELFMPIVIESSKSHLNTKETPLFTMYIDTNFISNQELLTITSLFNQKIKESGWGRILVNTKKEFTESVIPLSYSNHMYFRSNETLTKIERSELKVGQFYLCIDSTPIFKQPHFARFVAIREEKLPDSIKKIFYPIELE